MNFGPYSTAGTIQNDLWRELGRKVPEPLAYWHYSEFLRHYSERAYKYLLRRTNGYPRRIYVKHTSGTREYDLSTASNVVLPTGFATVKNVHEVLWRDTAQKWWSLENKSLANLNRLGDINTTGDPRWVAIEGRTVTVYPAPDATDADTPTRLQAVCDMNPTLPTSDNEGSLEPCYDDEYHDIVVSVARAMVEARVDGRSFVLDADTEEVVRELVSHVDSLRDQVLEPNDPHLGLMNTGFQRDYFSEGY